MASNQSIRLIIADDHALVRAGLHAYLDSQSDFALLGEAENGNDAVQLCEMFNPDLVLMDDQMPGMDGFSAARVIHQRWPSTRVILLLSEVNNSTISASKDAGAAGYLYKNISREELLVAIRDVLRGQHVATSTKDPILQVGSAPFSASSEDRTTQELEIAGRIQSKILPEKPPSLQGWDISASLESAYETSGDFYDFIPLAYGKWGIVLGDVASKGLGAAIFMAFANSLIRTYATHYPIMPAMMMHAVNERLHADTRSGMFVTTFFGVLDPQNGRLIYVNAGHNPPILVSSNKGKPVDQLAPTGAALGIFKESTWQQKMIKFSPGDVLLMYTDGITEAQNARGDFFDDGRLLDVLRANRERPAKEIQRAVLNAVKRFTGSSAHADDIALIVVSRKS